MTIFERIYDNPKNKDGTPKSNKKLGNFRIIKTIYKDSYTSKRIGIMNGKKYFIEEYEVSGFNGGSRFEITNIN